MRTRMMKRMPGLVLSAGCMLMLCVLAGCPASTDAKSAADTNNDGVLSLEEALTLPDMTEARFAELDVNADGSLSKDELPAGQEGRKHPKFEDQDTDGDGVLSLEEALALPGMTEARFTELDANADGSLSKDEMPARGEGRKHPKFEDLDTNSDGVLSLEEALAIPGMTEAKFTELDANADGSLSEDEKPAPPEGRGHPKFEDQDTDGDGVLSLEEALALPGMTEAHFTELDANTDGFLSKDELPTPPEGGPRHGNR